MTEKKKGNNISNVLRGLAKETILGASTSLKENVREKAVLGTAAVLFTKAVLEARERPATALVDTAAGSVLLAIRHARRRSRLINSKMTSTLVEIKADVAKPNDPSARST